MRNVAGSRRGHPDILANPPGDGPLEDRSAALVIDAVAQMAELADLVARGLVSPSELELQRRKVFGALSWTRSVW